MVAPYAVRIHPYSRRPVPGGRYYLLQVVGTADYVFSQTPAGPASAPVLYGSAPDILAMKISAEGACIVQSLNGDGEAVIKPLSNEETSKLRADSKGVMADMR